MFSTLTPNTRRGLRRAALVLFLAMCGSLIAACGDDTDSDAVAPPADDAIAAADDVSDDEELERLTLVAPYESLHYLPLRIAMDEGFFAEEGLDVQMTTISGPTSGHVSAVLSGEAWAFAGGLEHVALANAENADLRAVLSFASNVTTAIVAADDAFELGDDPAAALAGKRIAVSEIGRTPHFLIRAYLESLGLDPDQDVTLIEGTEGARLAALASGQADLAVISELPAAKGIADGLWDEIVFDLSDFGPYLQPVMGLRASSIEEEPDTVEAFVRAVVRAQQWIYAEPDAALELAVEAYPETDRVVLEQAFSRSLERELWAADGAPGPGTFEAVAELAASLTDEEVDVEAAFDDRFLAEAGG